MEEEGLDSAGRAFRNAREMWREEIGCAGEGQGDAKRKEWYQKGIAYWEGIEASVDGVLGGYGCVNEADVRGSEVFLKTLLTERFGAERRHLVALDCGSGIGRVTKNLLLRYFNEVDLVEPVSNFLEAARKALTLEGNTIDDGHKATNFFCTPLQEFTPQEGRYDVIWIQWCIGQLPDDDFVSFFKRAKHSKRSSVSSSSSSSSNSSSSDDEERDSRRSKSRSKRRKKEKKHKSRAKYSSSDSEESGSPVRLSRFFGSAKD